MEILGHVELKLQLRELARDAGFFDVRVTRAILPDEHRERLRGWLARGMHGEMEYMEKWGEKRVRPENLLPGARSVIVFAASYAQPHNAQTTPHGDCRVAAYAVGQDYHQVLRQRLEPVVQWLQDQFSHESFRICTDSAPLLERAYAEQAGIGFFGRSTMLIAPEHGTMFFLAEILTTAELEPDEAIAGTCGTCTRCIDACPTGAITREYEVDARRCISYLTIEKKSELTEDEQAAIGEWVFGCDICQDVCPYNKSPQPLMIPEFLEGERLQRRESPERLIGTTSNRDFMKKFRGSPLLRPGRRRLLKNVQTVLRNLQRKQLRPSPPLPPRE